MVVEQISRYLAAVAGEDAGGANQRVEPGYATVRGREMAEMPLEGQIITFDAILTTVASE